MTPDRVRSLLRAQRTDLAPLAHGFDRRALLVAGAGIAADPAQRGWAIALGSVFAASDDQALAKVGFRALTNA